MLSKRDLINMLRLDRSEKAAGRDAGAEAWSNAIGALQSAGIPKSAWAMIEGRLVLELDKDSAGTGDTFLTPPQPPQNKPKAGARVPHLVDAAPRSESGVNVTLMPPKIEGLERSQRAQPRAPSKCSMVGWLA
jgi:hypothetical protein